MSSFENARRASTPIVTGDESGFRNNEPMMEDMGLLNYPNYQYHGMREDEISEMEQQLLK